MPLSVFSSLIVNGSGKLLQESEVENLIFYASSTDNNLINTSRKEKPLKQDLRNWNGRKDINDDKRKFHSKTIWISEKNKE